MIYKTFTGTLGYDSYVWLIFYFYYDHLKIFLKAIPVAHKLWRSTFLFLDSVHIFLLIKKYSTQPSSEETDKTDR